MPLLRTLVRSAQGDDTAVLQAAFDEVAGAGGGEVVLTPGVFAYTGNLVLRANTTLRGNGGRLLARDPDRAAILIEGEDVAVVGIDLRVAATRRTGADRAMGLRAAGCRGLTIRDCTIEGTAAAGILLRGCEDVRISGNTVRRTLADGIHVTGRSRGVVIVANRLIDTGDDGIGCVGYEKDGGPLRGIVVTGNYVRGGRARGIAVLGAEDVAVSGNVITGTAAAGIYVAQEDNYATYAPRAVAVTGNVLSDVSRRVGHAGLFVRGGSGRRRTAEGDTRSDRIGEVTLVGNIVDGSGNDGMALGPDADGVVARGNRVTNARRRGLAVSGDGIDAEGRD